MHKIRIVNRICGLLLSAVIVLFPLIARELPIGRSAGITTDAGTKKTAGRIPYASGLPAQATWFWTEVEFEPDGYKRFIDLTAVHARYDLLSVSVRRPGREVTTQAVHDQIKAAAAYAATKGIYMVADLDIRTARLAFQEKYPDEMQEMLLLQEADLISGQTTSMTVKSIQNLSDHYTGATTKYIPLSGKLLRVYAYREVSRESDPEGKPESERDDNGKGGQDGSWGKNRSIDPKTLEDITSGCKTRIVSKDSVCIEIPPMKKYTRVCALVSFTHFTPDVFAPHLFEFQREIIRQYANTPLVGVFKDEWGFPPGFDGSPRKDQFWYSAHRAKAYAETTDGRDLLYDCLLMHQDIAGKERERRMAINHFMKMSWQRNGAIEDDFYHAVKETFGPDAAVTTHPTWYPYPDCREQMKNGLDWWVATRDWAQTDEITPFAARTSLSKKWGSPIWYNMYYATERKNYEFSVWSGALGGGRINYHPLYPSDKSRMERLTDLFRGGLMQAENRVRLLNYISNSPLDCPVAVIFGHACTMNWAGPAYDDAGTKLAESLWLAGIPADLIPSSEIENGSLSVDAGGQICYGQQRYAAVVMYHPEFETPATAAFFQKASRGPTLLIRKGDWTQDFDAQPFDGNKALPSSMKVINDSEQILAEIKKTLAGKFEPNTPAIIGEEMLGYQLICPPSTGHSRLTDGTLIQIAGTENAGGDRIWSEMRINGYPVIFDAEGVAAIRLNRDGKVEALAAGGLKSVTTADFTIQLDKRLDLALWKNASGRWEGIIQGEDTAIPSSLLEITNQWSFITPIVPYSEYDE